MSDERGQKCVEEMREMRRQRCEDGMRSDERVPDRPNDEGGMKDWMVRERK